MNAPVTFKVFDTKTGKDVTNDYLFFISPDGEVLRFNSWYDSWSFDNIDEYKNKNNTPKYRVEFNLPEQKEKQ